MAQDGVGRKHGEKKLDPKTRLRSLCAGRAVAGILL